MVRKTATAPKMGVAGVMLENSFARFRPSMAALSEEWMMSPSCAVWVCPPWSKRRCYEEVARGRGRENLNPG